MRKMELTLIKMCQEKKSVTFSPWLTLHIPVCRTPHTLRSPFLRSDLSVLLPSNLSVQNRDGSPVAEKMLSLIQSKRNTNGNYPEIPLWPSVAKGQNPVAHGAGRAVGRPHSRPPRAGVGAKLMD